MTTTTPLRGISEIRAFFRTNQTPIYFVSPTAFNLLGIDRWVRNLFYVNYFDSFEGTHPRVFVPQERPYREFESMEDICNELLAQPRGQRGDRASRPGRQGRLRHVRRGDRGARREGGPGGRAPVGRAAPPARLEDRHDPARERRRRPQRAEHARPREELRGAARARRRGRPRPRSRRPDAVRRLGQDDVLHQDPRRLGPERRRAGRRGAQGHEAHQLRARRRSRRC